MIGASQFGDPGHDLLRLILESMPLGIVVIDASGSIVMINGRLAALFGYTREELIGQPIEMLVPERHRASHVGDRNTFLAHPQARPMASGRDLMARRKDGSEFPVEIDLSSIRTPRGLLVLGAVADITARKADMEARRQSQERVRAILDSALDAVVTMDEAGRVTGWNPKAETTFGWTRDEAIGRTMSELIVPERFRDKHTQGLRNFLTTGVGPVLNRRLELSALRKTGEEFPIELTISPIRIGARYEFSAFVRDITERHKAAERLSRTQRLAALNLAQDADEARKRAERNEEALELANQELQNEITQRQKTEDELRHISSELGRSNAELEQFAYIASHDLQEPLRKVQAFGDLLAAQAGAGLGEEERGYLKRMQAAAQRMQGLITDLLTFARVTSKAKPFVPVDLAQVAREVLSDLDARLKSSVGSVQLGELPQIEGDATQLRQLLQNLIGNALKFHRPDEPPVIAVTARLIENVPGAADAPLPHSLAPQVCEIAVTDNGIGFEEKYLERIFIPFQRLHGRGEYEGTGMGLAICRKIVERHGGILTARSLPGQGSTFIVLLPTTHPGEASHD